MPLNPPPILEVLKKYKNFFFGADMFLYKMPKKFHQKFPSSIFFMAEGSKKSKTHPPIPPPGVVDGALSRNLLAVPHKRRRALSGENR